jgi:hypothetical protein
MELKGKNLGGRAYLIGKLMASGLSRRTSVLVVNAILERMIYRLRRGQSVKFPFGTLKRARRHFSEWWDAMDDWPANRDGYTVEWELDGEGRRLLEGERSRPPPPAGA